MTNKHKREYGKVTPLDSILLSGPCATPYLRHCYCAVRVARYPVFYGISRILDPFVPPPGEAAGKNKSPVFC